AGSEIEQNASSSSVELPRSIITYRRGAGPVPAAGALFAEPLPPAPSPKRRGGAEGEQAGLLYLLPAEGGRCCLSPPLRLGEGVGGRGSGNCQRPGTSRTLTRASRFNVALSPDLSVCQVMVRSSGDLINTCALPAPRTSS